ncbi:hypothetical protein GH714_041476 [Hevea brasiliensis]|uniref:Uncharacterized protein n=1 Tax=Hevea brasiliensis TaxID=3981 RepID=A0A6A6MYE2_HEVBR|nr:hypothetical protein GH714_041476 [Hevea brasiliensis]
MSQQSSLAAARADNFYYPPEWTPKQEEDLQKKKEAEPVLVQLQRVSDARHSDDCALHKALQAQLRSQKKRVAEEEFASSKMGLGIRLLPTTKEDACIAAHVKFSSRFEKNRKDKRASINAASIFPESFFNKKHLELEDKRRKISVAAAYNLLSGGLKPSSWL